MARICRKISASAIIFTALLSSAEAVRDNSNANDVTLTNEPKEERFMVRGSFVKDPLPEELLPTSEPEELGKNKGGVEIESMAEFEGLVGDIMAAVIEGLEEETEDDEEEEGLVDLLNEEAEVAPAPAEATAAVEEDDEAVHYHHFPVIDTTDTSKEGISSVQSGIDLAAPLPLIYDLVSVDLRELSYLSAVNSDGTKTNSNPDGSDNDNADGNEEEEEEYVHQLRVLKKEDDKQKKNGGGNGNNAADTQAIANGSINSYQAKYINANAPSSLANKNVVYISGGTLDLRGSASNIPPSNGNSVYAGGSANVGGQVVQRDPNTGAIVGSSTSVRAHNYQPSQPTCFETDKKSQLDCGGGGAEGQNMFFFDGSFGTCTNDPTAHCLYALMPTRMAYYCPKYARPSCGGKCYTVAEHCPSSRQFQDRVGTWFSVDDARWRQAEKGDFFGGMWPANMGCPMCRLG